MEDGHHEDIQSDRQPYKQGVAYHYWSTVDIHYSHIQTHRQGGTYHFPKMSSFYGVDGKGESWETFKFEVEPLVVEKGFSEEQIILGVR